MSNVHYIILNDDIPVGIMSVGPPRYDNTGNDKGIDESFWELHGIYLHPDYYRRVIGTKALEFAMYKAKEAGKKNMFLWVLEENVNAVRFYEKCGFSPDGSRKAYDCGKEVYCIRMKRTL